MSNILIIKRLEETTIDHLEQFFNSDYSAWTAKPSTLLERTPQNYVMKRNSA